MTAMRGATRCASVIVQRYVVICSDMIGASTAAPKPPSMLLGVACGAGAALCWAVGFVAARHGIDIGFTPAELALHRFVWSGFAFLPLIFAWSWAEFRWERGIVLTFFGGPPLAL